MTSETAGGGDDLLTRVMHAAGQDLDVDGDAVGREIAQADPEAVARLRDRLLAIAGAMGGDDLDSEEDARGGPVGGADPERQGELLNRLLPFSSALDQVVWGTWANVAPRSPLKRTGSLADDATRYLSGEEPDAERVGATIDRLRQLTAAMISAVGLTSRRYAEWHHRRFAPSEIESLAKLDRRISGSGEVACWRKYREMADSFDESSIEADLHKEIVGYVEPLLK